MAVTVTLPSNETIEYDGGRYLAVQEGALFISNNSMSGAQGTVAVHAAGTWSAAYNDSATQAS